MPQVQIVVLCCAVLRCAVLRCAVLRSMLLQCCAFAIWSNFESFIDQRM